MDSESRRGPKIISASSSSLMLDTIAEDIIAGDVAVLISLSSITAAEDNNTVAIVDVNEV